MFYIPLTCGALSRQLCHYLFDDLLRLKVQICVIYPRKFPMACSLHLWPHLTAYLGSEIEYVTRARVLYSADMVQMSFFNFFFQILAPPPTPAGILYTV